MRAYRSAISTATIAASAPRLPALAPARSTACSMVSQASTPNATAILPSAASAPTPARRFADDQIEVRRGAADHRAQADDAVEAAGVGHPPRQARDLHGARAAKSSTSLVVGAGARAARRRAPSISLLDDEVVEARGDDGEAPAVGATARLREPVRRAPCRTTMPWFGSAHDRRFPPRVAQRDHASRRLGSARTRRRAGRSRPRPTMRRGLLVSRRIVVRAQVRQHLRAQAEVAQRAPAPPPRDGAAAPATPRSRGQARAPRE